MKYLPIFQYDIQQMIKCSFGNKPRFGVDPMPVRIARSMGWHGNNYARAAHISIANRSAPRGSKVNIWGGDLNHVFHPDKIVGYAVQARRIIAERKKFISNHYLKTNAVLEAYHLLQRKT